MNLSCMSLLLFLAITGTAAAYSQAVRPWSNGTNNPAAQRGFELHLADVDNVPDIHGNSAGARLVIFVGGNQFFVLPKLITAFEQKHPELQGHIFHETPPGILRTQIAADGAITLGNLTGGVFKNEPHPELAAQWLEFLKSREVQDIYHQFGFGSIPNSYR